MTISKIYLGICEGSLRVEDSGSFALETRFITEYISKFIAQCKFKYLKANRLIVNIDCTQSTVKYFEVFKTYECELERSYSELSGLEGRSRTEWILQIILSSSKLYEDSIPGIGDAVSEAIESFRLNGYKNEWIFQKRRLKGIGTVKLACELNRDNFHLYLIVESKEGEIYRKEVLKELPDSLSYHHLFRTLVIDKDLISIVDRFDETIFQISKDEICEHPMN